MTKKINKKFKKLFRNFKSFSLVELIIVIAIIAILSVAGFMTLTKWIGKSRNSRRISDLKSIEKALTINYTEKGKYPTPSNNGGVNYSGSTLWKQGTFGKETIDKMDEFTVVPKDPLTKTGYDYSVTENQKKYEISAALERIGIAYTDIRKYVDKVYAGDYYSKVLGNYDSLSLGVKTGANNCYTLSIPSIIISDFTGKNIEIEADGSKKYNFVMEGGKNIGPSYKSALKKTRKGTKFGVKSVYSKCEIQNLTDFNDFSSGLHLAYSGEKITETPSFDHSIGDIGNSGEDVEVRTESYKELEDSDIVTLSNDVSEEIGNDINGSEESGGGKNQINMNVDGGGSIDGLSSANTNESVILTGVPDTGWKFDSWNGDKCDGNTNITCSFTMPASDMSITANFSEKEYVVSTSAGSNGSIDGNQTVTHGNDVTISAIPDTGYKVDSWNGCNNTNGTECTLSNVTSDSSVSVSFKSFCLGTSCSEVSDDYYVVYSNDDIDGDGTTEGCNEDSLTNANEKCILYITTSDFYIAPDSTDVAKNHANCDNCYVGEGSTNGEAATYCTNLTAGGIDWQLPTKSELLDIYNKKSMLGIVEGDQHWQYRSSDYGGIKRGPKWRRRHMGNGETAMLKRSFDARVRCVAK